MRRGEIWTVSGGADYAGKPRPALIVQADAFSKTSSVTLLPFTSDATDAPLLRIPIEPSKGNGLARSGRLMVDKISTVARTKVDKRLGRLEQADLSKVNAALIVFLGLA